MAPHDLQASEIVALTDSGRARVFDTQHLDIAKGAFADGSVLSLRSSCTAETLKSHVTVAGGETLKPGEF